MNIERIAAWVGIAVTFATAAGSAAVFISDVEDLKSKSKEQGEKIRALELRVATVAKGDTGPQGPKGEQGEPGPKGAPGERGEPGRVTVDSEGKHLIEECEQMAISEGLQNGVKWLAGTEPIYDRYQVVGMRIRFSLQTNLENAVVICEKYDNIKYPVIRWEKPSHQQEVNK